MDSFQAIADPTRRAILDMLVDQDCAAGDLVTALSHISQPAVSRHLRVLREAGLVSVRVVGQSRRYALQPEGLREIEAWLGRHGDFWVSWRASQERRQSAGNSSRQRESP